MLKFKQTIKVSLAILIALTAMACGALSPAVTPTQENTGWPTVTPTLLPYIPTLEGAVHIDSDLAGYDLRYQCFGEGSPTVIVEAGAGDAPITSLSWKAVTQNIQSITRMCIYDRVGGVRTSRDVAGNLHFLLGEISVPGPYILVAHSLGGWHARVFAHLYPQEVVGMILVDTTPITPDSTIALATAYPTYSPNEVPDITQNRLSKADIFTIGAPPSLDGLDMQTSNNQVRQAGKFGDIPLVVISQNWQPEDFPGRDPVTQKELAALVLKVAADLTNLSSRGVFVVAQTSNHFISRDEPQIVIDAITQMVAEIRNP